MVFQSTNIVAINFHVTSILRTGGRKFSDDKVKIVTIRTNMSACKLIITIITPRSQAQQGTRLEVAITVYYSQNLT